MGKNGTLNNCKFINNTARGIGGAIYMGGENNTLINSVFINNLGQLSHESVYLDRNRKNINFTNCVFESGDKYIIDGTISNIDVKYLKYNIDSYFSDVKFNLVYILYSAMMNAGMNYIGNDISYCAVYNNKTKDITLSIVRYFDEYGVSYGKDYIFKNIDDLNEVFTLMYGGSFVNDITIVVDRYVNSEADYNAARTTEIYSILNGMGDVFDHDFEGYLPLNNPNTILKVNFEKQLNFKSTKPWIPQCIGFNTVILNGHGSTIEGTYDTDDEYQWAIISKGCSFIASNFTIKGYNSAIVNDGGYCAVSDTIFDSNKMDYLIHEDYGGAVRNKGICIFNNCSFINNYAKYGGAIYNEGVLILNQCTFRDNEGYNKGNNVFLCEGAQVTVDGKNITETTDIVYVYESTIVDAICVIATSVVFVVASILICYAAVEIFVMIAPFASVAGVIAVAGVSLILTAGLIFVAYQSLTGPSEGNDDMNTGETFNFSPVSETILF